MYKEQVISAEDRLRRRQESDLLEAVKNGDRNAFQQLYEAHCGRVYALCYRITGQVGLAEDASQEVFIQVWRKIGDFRHDSRFSTWLHSIAINTALAALRKNKSWISRMVSIGDEPAAESSTQIDSDDHSLDVHIARLPERARIVFILRAIEGYRHEEIATKMNMAVGTSKSQYARARSLLKEWIDT